MNDIEQKKKRRFQFLRRMYEVTGGNEHQLVNMWDLGKELGWDKGTTDMTVQYLVGEGLAKYLTMGGGLVITHWGIKQIEEAITNPKQETRYFPPVNVIQISTMTNSQIEQASPGGVQQQVMEEELDLVAVRKLTDAILSKMDELELSDTARKDLECEIATIQAQAEVSDPKKPFIRECLSSIRSILEQAAGSAAAAGLMNTLSNLT